MKVVKKNSRANVRLSMVLLDWSVRESFHLFHYLRKQTTPRDQFEVIIVEYYNRVSEALKPFEGQVDTWVLLEMPKECYYHKHLMYNAGIVLSQGEIVMIGDSDAMVKETFVETILHSFQQDKKIVYHIDQFRNIRRDFYPFSYPSFDEVLGEGCINNMGGKTTGILDQDDPMHSRNYGSCMCARREDLIAIGGADEHIDYLGHVCGPYDMTFRLMNYGRRLVWGTEEYMYHTWHPGSDGADNYIGPHDGKNMSTTAFQALLSGRTRPLVMNPTLRTLQKLDPVERQDSDPLLAELINPDYVRLFQKPSQDATDPNTSSQDAVYASYKGIDIYVTDGTFFGVHPQLTDLGLVDEGALARSAALKASSFSELKEIIDAWEPRLVESIGTCNIVQVNNSYAVVPQCLGPVNFFDKHQRLRPEIVWTGSLFDARMAAEKNAQPLKNINHMWLANVLGGNGQRKTIRRLFKRIIGD